MKILTVGGAMIDTIAIIDSDRIERMTMLNADSSFLLLEEGRKTEAEEVSTHPWRAWEWMSPCWRNSEPMRGLMRFWCGRPKRVCRAGGPNRDARANRRFRRRQHVRFRLPRGDPRGLTQVRRQNRTRSNSVSVAAGFNNRRALSNIPQAPQRLRLSQPPAPWLRGQLVRSSSFLTTRSISSYWPSPACSKTIFPL